MLPPGAESQPPPPPPPPPQERAVERLGDLPPDLLNQILSCLPAGDVIRTSVLSPPWSHRWETVAGLDIVLHGLRDDEGVWRSAAGFLERCAGPVGRVSIGDVPLGVHRRADDWVRAVAGKSPRSLSLELPWDTWTPLPSLFRCDPAALEELVLRCCEIRAPPAGFAGFHRLTKLDLDDVVFMGESAWTQLEAMVSAAAPTLVELRLQNVEFPVAAADDILPSGRWVIQAPNLRRLVLSLWNADAGLWELGPLPNLECARIFLTDDAEDRDYVQMFTAISNVRELHFGNFRMLTQGDTINIFRDLLGRFKNLRILRLDGCFHEPQTNNLFNLSPSLETVEIKRWY